MNRFVAQAFQPAGLPDFRVRWTRNGRLESRPNPQARKPALRTRLDVEATHEPERRAPARRGVACPECADLEIGAPSTRFMVPMRATYGVEALHERLLRSAGCQPAVKGAIKVRG